jgi:lipopolysaccharide/colanic/teichoic acid biosynthesis glycosyltransferase
MSARPIRRYRLKRMLDLGLITLACVPAACIGAVIAVLVKLSSRGPVLFRQERIGKDGIPFEILKFRTMLVGDNPLFPDATRITRVGSFLRRSSLDEIPELINVVRGEMSIVGPRPTLPYQVERYDARQRHRLAVRPGITGLAQVRGRNELPWAERIEMDLDYIKKQSVWFDVKILIWSVLAVARGSGVEGHPLDDPIARPD